MVKEIISEIKNIIEVTSKSEKIYGIPIEKDNITVIPVSKISYSAGGGFGKGRSNLKKENNEKGERGGYGLKASTKPVGYIKIQNNETSFEPIVDVNQILKHTFLFSGLSLLFFFKFIIKIKRKRR